MARYVKISTIGARTPPFPSEGTTQEKVDIMIKFWEEKLSKVTPDNPDIILLPEACDRFCNISKADKKEYYATRKDQLLEFFQKNAKKNNCYIAYSAARELPDGTWRNSTRIIDRSGNIAGTYNKNHLVLEENTENGILYGKDTPVIKCDFGTVGCVICFDLNFDELRLKYKNSRPDILLFSSMYHGGLMQNYWAYSCRSHFVGSIHGLRSSIISPLGEELAHTTNYIDYVTATVNLDCELVHLDYHWEKLDNLKKKYGSKVSILDPGHLGSVLVSSESDEFTIHDLLKEFELEKLDDYMARVMAHRHTEGNIEP